MEGGDEGFVVTVTDTTQESASSSSTPLAISVDDADCRQETKQERLARRAAKGLAKAEKAARKEAKAKRKAEKQARVSSTDSPPADTNTPNASAEIDQGDAGKGTVTLSAEDGRADDSADAEKRAKKKRRKEEKKAKQAMA